jgi:hypothetical protein
MARLGAAEGKDHRPGDVGHPAEQLAIDEIGDTSEEQPERHGSGDDVDQAPGRDAAMACEQRHRQDRAEKAAVERHAALPDGEDLQRVRQKTRQVVEEHVSGAAAEDDAEGSPDDKVVDVGRLEWRARRCPKALVAGKALGVPPADEDAGDIGSAYQRMANGPISISTGSIDGKGRTKSVIGNSSTAAANRALTAASGQGAARRLATARQRPHSRSIAARPGGARNDPDIQ